MRKWISGSIFFTIVLSAGLLIFVVLSHIRPLLPYPVDLFVRIFVISVLLAFSLLVRRNKKRQQYWRIPYAFFIASLATSVDYYLPSSRLFLMFLDIPIRTPIGVALDKLDSSIILIVLILLLTRLSGDRPESLYLRKGNLRTGLIIGIIAFLVCAGGSFFVAQMFGAQDLSLAKIWKWIPWILIFILGNALNEELLFRGLFLRKTEPFIGKFLSNLVIAIPFVLHHTGVTYTNDALIFLAYLLPLSLLWGYITQKTDSLLGAVLFHAGTDIPVVLVIFSTLA